MKNSRHYLVTFILVIIAFIFGNLSRPWLSTSDGLEAASPIILETPDLQEPSGVPQANLNLDLLAEAWQILQQDFYGEKPDSIQVTYKAMHGLIGSVDDPYTFFVEPQPRALERDELRGSFGGIGAYIESSEDGYVLRPMRNQPAAIAGILEGDLLRRIDDTDITRQMSAEEIATLIRGPLETEVTLLIQRRLGLGEETSEIEFHIVRAEIQTPSVEWRILDDEASRTIGYIKQRVFSERSPGEMQTAIQELSENGADRFILDLRGNPGGLVNSVIEIAEIWLGDVTIFIETKADGTEKLYDGTTDALAPNAPIVVVVDGGTASASEILAGALRDHGRGLLVGEQTFGKGSVQLIRELSDKSSIHVTNARWFTPNGHKIDGEGLTPDIVTPVGEDPLPKAIETVLGING